MVSEALVPVLEFPRAGLVQAGLSSLCVLCWDLQQIPLWV